MGQPNIAKGSLKEWQFARPKFGEEVSPLPNLRVPEHPYYRRYRDCNRVEHIFGKLKQQRRIATRYDKTGLSFESFLNLAAARFWIKSLVNTTEDANIFFEAFLVAPSHK